MQTRPPAVAGMFYPGTAEELAATVDALLGAVAAPAPPPKALIVPHAGYVYSGSTAALGYATLPAAAGTIRHVVIVGPTHRVGIRGIALPDADALATPLGDVPVWDEGVRIALDQPHVEVSGRVHAEEHSLEVQLPFLQRVLPQADVLALAAGWVSPEAVADTLDAVWGDASTLILISSDLSHYHPYDEARAIDASTIGQILALDAGIDHEQACGATGVDGLLLAARAHHLRPSLLGACNSGDTAGDKAGVVGYACVAFYEEART